MVKEAMQRLEVGQSSWRPAETLRELAAAFPTTTPADAQQLTGWLEALSEQTVETQCVDLRPPGAAGTPVRRDGRLITEASVDRRLSTEAILEQEERIVAWADQRLDEPPTRGRIDDRDLDPGQAEVAATVAGDRRLELIEGPAGAGKTTALATGVIGLRSQGRSAFGVAPTAAAAQVLATETGMPADTLDKLLVEHSLTARPPLPDYDLPGGATIVVDEAGTASTPALARLADLSEERDWRIVLVGDPRQFAAVGRGGMFAHLIDRHGCVGLDQIHRFRNEWERRASLQLRNGQPEALAEYDRHGRLHGGTAAEMETKIIEAWSAARQRRETVALMANSNQAVDRLNQLAQMARFINGDISFQKVRVIRLNREVVGVGDEVVTRRNDRSLRTDRGVMVKNRDQWTVETIHPDRSMTLTGPSGTVQLPAEYVARDLRLGYAQTSHATQGRTVDTALLLVDTPTDHAGIYTPLTRGRDANHAYVITEDNQAAVDVLTQAAGRQWIDRPAVSHADPRVEPTALYERTREEEMEYLMNHAQQAMARRRAQARESPSWSLF
jgi:ATP-dependent exoDNAse (exonuclease V) alpha subunit